MGACETGLIQERTADGMEITTIMKNLSKESVFAISVIAAAFPFVFMVLSLFENAEPYNDIVFGTYLMEGALVGSVFGIIALICNRRIRSIKIYLLSLVPVFALLVSLIGDYFISRNMP